MTWLSKERRLIPTRASTTSVVLASVLLIPGATAAAQSPQMGVKGGINLADVKVEADHGGATFDFRMGLVAGGFVTWGLASWLEVQPEVLYSSKGAKHKEEGIDSRLVLDYVEVPVLGRFSQALSGMRIYLGAGPTFAVRVRAKERIKFSGSTEERDISDDVERFDIGAAVGGGLEIGSFVFDGRYTFGLTDIDVDTSDKVKITNRVITFTVGINF
jgi:hypothetical protein